MVIFGIKAKFLDFPGNQKGINGGILKNFIKETPYKFYNTICKITFKVKGVYKHLIYQ